MRAASVVLLSLALAGCAGATPDTTEADMKAAGAARDAFAKAYTDENAAGAAATFTPDGALMEDERQVITGRDAIRAHYEQLMTDMQTDLELKSQEMVVSGDWAFDRGQTWVHIMSKDPASTLPMIMDQGKYTALLKRQPDGSWLLASLMTNSNIAPPPPPEAK